MLLAGREVCMGKNCNRGLENAALGGPHFQVRGHSFSLFRPTLKARLHRRFLSRQWDAIFLAPKMQLQNNTCKPVAIFSAICCRDIAGVSNMFETCCNFSATKIASSCRDKNRLCKRALSRPITYLSFFFCDKLAFKWVCLRNFVIELAYATFTNHSQKI